MSNCKICDFILGSWEVSQMWQAVDRGGQNVLIFVCGNLSMSPKVLKMFSIIKVGK